MGRRKRESARISLKCRRVVKEEFERNAKAAGVSLSAYIVVAAQQVEAVKEAAAYTTTLVLDKLGLTTPPSSDHPHRPFSLENPTGLAAQPRCESLENLGKMAGEKKEGGEGAGAGATNEGASEGSEIGQSSETGKNLARLENFGKTGLGEIGPGMGGVLDRLIARCGRAEAFELMNRIGDETGKVNTGLDPEWLARIAEQGGSAPGLAGELGNRAKILAELYQRIHGYMGAVDLRPSEAYPLLSLIFTRVRLREAAEDPEASERMRRELDELFAGTELSRGAGVALMGRFLMWIRENPNAVDRVNARLPVRVPSGSPESNDRKVLDNGKSGRSALDDGGEGTPAGSVAGWRVTRERALAGRGQHHSPVVGSRRSVSEGLHDRSGGVPSGVGSDGADGQIIPEASRHQASGVSGAVGESAAVSHSGPTLELDDEELEEEEEEPEGEEIPTCAKCGANLPPEFVCRSAKCQQAAIDEQLALRETDSTVKPRKAPPRPNQGLVGSPVAMAAPADKKHQTQLEKFRDKFARPKPPKVEGVGA